jgi:hypothetical protein
MMRICGFETGYVYAANGIPPCCQVLLNFVSFVMAAGLALYSYVKWGYGIRATPSDIFSQGIKAIIRWSKVGQLVLDIHGARIAKRL